MKIQKIDNFNHKNNQKQSLQKISVSSSKLTTDTIMFTSRKIPINASCVDIKKLDEFILDLAKKYISSKDSAETIGMVSDSFLNYTDKKQGKIFQYVSTLNDRLKINTIYSALERVDAFKDKKLPTMIDFDELAVKKNKPNLVKILTGLSSDTGFIVDNQEEAANIVNLIKRDFAFSTSSIENNQLKYKTVRALLFCDDKDVVMGAFQAIPKCDKRSQKKIIRLLASKKDTFREGGFMNDKIREFVEISPDEVQLEMLEKYAPNITKNQEIGHISSVENIQNPQNFCKLANIMIKSKNPAIQNDVIRVLKKAPEGKAKDESLKLYINNLIETNNDIPYINMGASSLPDILKMLKDSSDEIKADLLPKVAIFKTSFGDNAFLKLRTEFTRDIISSMKDENLQKELIIQMKTIDNNVKFFMDKIYPEIQ